LTDIWFQGRFKWLALEPFFGVFGIYLGKLLVWVVLLDFERAFLLIFGWVVLDTICSRCEGWFLVENLDLGGNLQKCQSPTILPNVNQEF
jgi:hypothetical protein